MKRSGSREDGGTSQTEKRIFLSFRRPAIEYCTFIYSNAGQLSKDWGEKN